MVLLVVFTLCVVVAAEICEVLGASHPQDAELLPGGARPHAEHPGADTRTLESDARPLTDIMSHQHLACGNHCSMDICDEICSHYNNNHKKTN